MCAAFRSGVGQVAVPHGSNLDGGDEKGVNENQKRPREGATLDEILRKCAREDSNLWPSPSEGDALIRAELRARNDGKVKTCFHFDRMSAGIK